MDWTRALDGYCERLGPEFWAEPVNALTNLAFVIAAAVMWPRVSGLGRVLAVILALIGLGSFLFHTVAQAWAASLDVGAILAFVLVYIYAANRDFWGLGVVASLGLTALFFPFAALTVPLFSRIEALGGSAGYMPVLLLIAIYAIALFPRAPALGRGLMIGVAILALSLGFRTLDLPLCGSFPLGTHFLWHILNAVMLGWMIEVWRRHALAGGARSG